MSGASLSQVGDLVVLLGLVVLFIEVLKSARPATSTIMDHMLSTARVHRGADRVSGGPGGGDRGFPHLVVISLIDVVAGYTVSIRTARRDVTFGGEV